MDYTDVIKNLCEAIYKNVENMGEKLKFDRTFSAIVVGIKSNGKCIVEYQDKKYTCDYSAIVREGDRVKICAPNNNWNRLFVISNKTTPAIQSKNQNGNFYYDEKTNCGVVSWYTNDGKLKLTVDNTGLSLDKITNNVATNIWSMNYGSNKN